MAGNKTLKVAKKERNDEFYTRLEDIEQEISMHPDYVRQFKDKVVFCNCDDPEWSNFHLFFRQHFHQLGLKKLITTHYNQDGSPSYKLEWNGEMLGEDCVNMVKTPLKGDGDFRSEECVDILKSADIVVTNPPFSLFREYIAQLIDNNKKFVVLGNPNAITYKDFFPLLKEEKLWLGYKSMGTDMYFHVSKDHADELVKTKKEGSGYVIKNGEILGRAMAVWYTNLDLDKRHEGLILTKNYTGNEEKYPFYDNYNAINVDKVKEIPKDYYEVIGVPITYMTDHSPEQFEILGLAPERLVEGESKLQIKRYVNAVQHNKDGSEVSGNKVNDGPVIVYDKVQKFPYYTSETVPNKILQVLYARVLIKRRA